MFIVKISYIIIYNTNKIINLKYIYTYYKIFIDISIIYSDFIYNMNIWYLKIIEKYCKKDKRGYSLIYI